LCLALLGSASWEVAGALIAAGGIVAVLGGVDDRLSLPASLRFGAQLVSADVALAFLGGMPPVLLGPYLEVPMLLNVIAAVGLLWLINLTNFMDGIDGIAASQAASVFVGAAILLELQGARDLALVCCALAGGSAGFLVHNWPPARIFMGDVSSGFLGLAFGTVMIAHVWRDPDALWTWLILFSVFIVDATVTLLRRAMRRERLSQAHRSHAYQHAARRWGHKPVTCAVILLNVLWLTPMAAATCMWPDAAPALFVAAVGPLIYAAVRLRAGEPEHRPDATEATATMPSFAQVQQLRRNSTAAAR
jgi:Fuc2NAc and GlcNAc transferase